MIFLATETQTIVEIELNALIKLNKCKNVQKGSSLKLI